MGIEFDHVVRDPNYYLKEEGIERATFGGKGARLMGLPEGFDPTVYYRLFDGLNPYDGSRLTERARKTNARGAIDITITQPKPVSIIRHVMGDERVDKAAEDAKRHALQLIEQQAAVRVRKGGKNEDRLSDNLVWLDVPHSMTRPAKADGEPDPHAHNHLVVFNLSHDKAEGIWKAVEFGRLDRKGISHAYHSRLAANMRKLGYQASWDGRRFKVAGIGKGVEDLFCRRRAECEDEKRKRGDLHPKTQARLAVITRAPKRPSVRLLDMVGRWVSRLTGEQLRQLTGLVERARFVIRREVARARLRSDVANLQRQAYIDQERSVGLAR
jgi:conjugative relaxase-like TrwC/TraI family protein